MDKALFIQNAIKDIIPIRMYVFGSVVVRDIHVVKASIKDTGSYVKLKFDFANGQIFIHTWSNEQINIASFDNDGTIYFNRQQNIKELIFNEIFEL